jgi:hypothetical protein
MTKDISTGMVIHKITVPVLSLQRKTSFPVWQSRKLQYQYCHRDVRRQYWYGNQEYYSTGTVIETFKVNSGMVIPKNPSTCNDISLVFITSIKNLLNQYCTSYFGAISVKYVCGYGDPAFAALVPVTYLLKITLLLWVALPVP